MAVNWNNLVSKIQNGQTAYENSSTSQYENTSTINFYDHPMSDLSKAAEDYYTYRPNAFVIGFNKWGSKTGVVAE